MPPDPADLALLADGALTVPQAVKFSGKCRARLFSLMREGVLPWFYDGSHRKIPKKALVELLAGQYAAHRKSQS